MTMHSWAEGIAVYAVLGATGLLAGAVISALLFAIGWCWLDRCPPRSRQRLLFALLLLPLVAAAAVILSLSAPVWLLAGGEALAHCSDHPQTHAALCQWHAPQVMWPAWLSWGVLLGIAIAVLALSPGLVRLRSTARRLRLLRRMARWQTASRYLLLPVAEPLAFAAGLFKPRAYISDGLRRRLDPRSLQIVLAHEHAHIRHRDLVASTMVSGLAKLHLPRFGQALRRAWQLAMEQRCDEAVARQTGDRLAVAECLVRVARLQQTHGTPLPASACHMLDGSLDARVMALLAGPRLPQRALTLPLAGLCGAAVSALLLGGPSLHHWIEHLLPAAGS